MSGDQQRAEFDAWYESGGQAVMHGTMTSQGQALTAFKAGWNAAKHMPGSVLDGTSSCPECRALILETNAQDHYEWHDKWRIEQPSKAEYHPLGSCHACAEPPDLSVLKEATRQILSLLE